MASPNCLWRRLWRSRLPGVGDDPSAVYVESFNVETLGLQTHHAGARMMCLWCFLETSWCEGMDLWLSLQLQRLLQVSWVVSSNRPLVEVPLDLIVLCFMTGHISVSSGLCTRHWLPEPIGLHTSSSCKLNVLYMYFLYNMTISHNENYSKQKYV